MGGFAALVLICAILSIPQARKFKNEKKSGNETKTYDKASDEKKIVEKEITKESSDSSNESSSKTFKIPVMVYVVLLSISGICFFIGFIIEKIAKWMLKK